jgi:parallel beta-helix repeat protein
MNLLFKPKKGRPIMNTSLKISGSVITCLVKDLLKKFLLIMFFVSISFAVFAATYYVAPNGNNSNPGTESQPWKTIQKAAETLVAGDIVYIKAGNYQENVTPVNSGGAGNYIVYTALNNDIVTIDGQNVTLPDWDTGLFHVEDLSYIKISGLRIINVGPNNNNNGIYLDYTNHIIIENNYIYNTISSGIGVWNSDNIIIDNNEIELACNDGEQECISVASTNEFVIKNNHIHDGGPGTEGGEGICPKDGSYNGKIYDNYVHDLPTRPGIYMDAWDKHTYNMEIFRNIVHDCGNDGILMVSEMGGLLENISVYNNIVYNNKYIGIVVTPNGEVADPPMNDMKIINNTVYNNGWNSGLEPWGGGIVVDVSNLSNLIIRNNIVSQNLYFQIAIEYYGQNFFVDHNLIDGFRGDLSEETQGNDYVEGNPMFVNAPGADFHLQENSPAIDKGSSNDAPIEDYYGNSRPFGADYDIGAFEYGQTSVESEQPDGVVSSFNLFQNYPNPFNPETKIMYQLPNSSFLETTIYNQLGQQITTLFADFQKAGFYKLTWDGRNSNGQPVASGVYVYQIKAGELTAAKKMLLIR